MFKAQNEYAHQMAPAKSLDKVAITAYGLTRQIMEEVSECHYTAQNINDKLSGPMPQNAEGRPPESEPGLLTLLDNLLVSVRYLKSSLNASNELIA